MPALTPIWKRPSSHTDDTLTVQKDSGTIVLADRATLVDVYKGKYAACVAGLVSRGTFGTGGRDGWVCTSSKVESSDGGAGQLTISWEAGGPSGNTAFLPSSEFNIDPIELYPKVERNSYFSGIELRALSDAYAAVVGSSAEARRSAYNAIQAYTDETQKVLANKLVEKLQNGIETFYAAGMRYTWSGFTFSLPSLSLGGFRQFPTGPGSVPSSLPLTMAFLRLADSLTHAGVNGSMYKRTLTWLGGPGGFWDPDIYP